MTGLFDRRISLQNPKQIIVDKPLEKDSDSGAAIEESAGKSLGSSEISPSYPPNEGAIEVNEDSQMSPIIPSQMGAFVDLGETDDIQFGGEKSPTDAILEMAGDNKDFAVKGVVRSPNAFTAAQVQANYNESLGFGSVAEILRKCCEWQYKHNSSDKGERAKLIFGALGTAKQEEFQLEKETKGLLGNK